MGRQAIQPVSVDDFNAAAEVAKLKREPYAREPLALSPCSSSAQKGSLDLNLEEDP